MKVENHRIEFKSQLTDSLEKEAVAFLNAIEGGVMIIGVNDKGKTIGIDNPKLISWIVTRAFKVLKIKVFSLILGDRVVTLRVSLKSEKKPLGSVH